MTPHEARAELNLPPDATPAQVKAAWRRLVSRWHPDRNRDPQAVQRIQRINQALECLQASATEADEPDCSPSQDPDTAAPPETATSSPHIDHTLDVSLEEAVLGGLRTLTGRYRPVCSSCQGHGSRSGAPQPCPRCKGKGQVHHVTWFVWGSFTETCPDCAGTGEHQPICATCDGQGHLAEQSWSLHVRLPAGSRPGDTLVVPTPLRSPSDPPADVHLHIAIAPHPLFSWDDDNVLHLHMPTGGFAWMGEQWVDVPVPGGWQRMRLRRNHLNYRLRGHGMAASARGERGDLVIHITPVFPETLTPEQSAWIDQLQTSLLADPPPALADWHTRLTQSGHPAQ